MALIEASSWSDGRKKFGTSVGSELQVVKLKTSVSYAEVASVLQQVSNKL